LRGGFMKDIELEIINTVHVLADEEQAKVLEFAKTLQKEATMTNGDESEKAKQKARFERLKKLSGMGSSGFTDTSERVDEILAEGINKREGWSLP